MSFGTKFILVRQVTAENGSSEDHRFWHLRICRLDVPFFLSESCLRWIFSVMRGRIDLIFFYSVDWIHADVMSGFIWIIVQPASRTALGQNHVYFFSEFLLPPNLRQWAWVLVVHLTIPPWQFPIYSNVFFNESALKKTCPQTIDHS